MPPAAQITRETIINAGFEIIRKEGFEALNLRRIASELNCSTRPMTYYFDNAEDLKKAVYQKTDRFHSEYLMNFQNENNSIMLNIGLNYIRFAIEEPKLFRFLFQSGYAAENSLLEMIESEELKPLLKIMGKAMETSTEQTKKIFVTIALFAHGYASIIANNSLEYDEKEVSVHLGRAYRGAVLAVKEEEKINEKII